MTTNVTDHPELQHIAARIMQHEDSAALVAAKDLAAAKARLDQGEFAPLKWRDWRRDALPLSDTRVCELLRP